ncbi:protein-disulfide reductase DsbD N-terminal domain-containing protein [Chitinimonas sp.]|uniref:protein-disulfide reductase DsbD N-terminal domain-containing protein n=1 Tax=Chitinimonas sp. TaxID=1934313 RepID=UPI002F943370
MSKTTFSFRQLGLLLLALAGLGSIPAAAAGNDWLGEVLARKPHANGEPLPPEQAFMPQLRRLDANRLRVDFQIQPGYYLYREKLLLALKDTPGLRISQIDYPQAISKSDPSFGTTQVYPQPFSVTLTLAGPGKGPITLLARYQGCFETRGVCYPPQASTLTVN